MREQLTPSANSILWQIYMTQTASETANLITQLERENPADELLPILIVFRDSYRKGILCEADLLHRTKSYLEEHRVQVAAQQLVEHVKQRVFKSY